MLACARIGAIHSVVFGGFSPEALAGRIQDCDSTLVITADEGLRGGKPIPLKANVDEALNHCTSVERVIVLKRTGKDVPMQPGRDVFWADALEGMADDCPPEEMGAEDPLFILYTSGSTGKPKGVLHTTGGYAVWTSMTHEYVFDYRHGQIYWCAADIGWVTGHSYIVYGPLANGATSLMFEGVPNWPDPSRIWQVVDKHQVEILYTAPTALRALMREGDEWVTAHLARLAEAARHGWRADQSRGLGLVSPRRRRRPLPDRRYLVADRNRRDHDLAAARRDAAQARQRDQADVRDPAGAGRPATGR